MATKKISTEIRELIEYTVESVYKDLLEKFIKLIPAAPPPTIKDEDFLSSVQAANFLKIKLSNLYAQVENNEIPFSRSGKRKLLFSKQDLEKHVAMRKNKSNKEISDEADNYILTKKP